MTNNGLPFALTEMLERMGKPGHGLMGKNADLDRGGQIKVERCVWHIGGNIKADLHVYANIVPRPAREGETEADYSRYMDAATELVCGTDLPGEWDGDYWTLSIGRHGGWPASKYVVVIPFSGGSTSRNIDRALDAIHSAIITDPKIVVFQSEASKLFDAMERLSAER